MDMVVQGTFAIRGGSGPLLEEAMFAVAKRVSDIFVERRPVFWQFNKESLKPFVTCYQTSKKIIFSF